MNFLTSSPSLQEFITVLACLTAYSSYVLTVVVFKWKIMQFLYVYSAFSASEFNNRESLNRSYRVRELSLIVYFYLAAMETCHTRITLSVYPANRVWPSADHAMEIHWGGSAFMLALITSGRSSSTTIFPSRSCKNISTVNLKSL